MFSIETIKPGDRIHVLGFGGIEAVGTVTDVYPVIKNGEPGLEYTLDPGVDDEYPSRWCYMRQVTDVRPARLVAR